MSQVNLKKLSRAELLEMMIAFSEEAEAAKKHEQEYKEELEREKLELQKEFAKERAAMLQSFDEEKAAMRLKFNEQKAEMQSKFDKDMAGLKARLTREKEELSTQVGDSLAKIEDSGNLAEATLKLSGIMESAQKAADLYVKSLQDKAKAEYEDFQKDLANARKQLIPEQPKEAEPKAKKTTRTASKTTTRKTVSRKKKEEPVADEREAV